MKKYLLLFPILFTGFIGCDSENVSEALETQEPSELLIGTWRTDSSEQYTSMLCSGEIWNTSTAKRYAVVTEDVWAGVEFFNCTLNENQYTWNENGGYGYIELSNGSIRNITAINETEMTYEISSSSYCYKYYLTKVTSVEGCPDL
tara:strand:+ start:126 stop:563 length:438 start_codon:yes stop_codon:yes gene_type:complete